MRPFGVALLASVALLAGCQKQDLIVTSGVVMLNVSALPAGPDDAAWSGAPEYRAELLLQDIVEPRLLKPSTSEVRVRALRGAGMISFRMEWTDSTLNDAMTPSQFSDACAVQLPADNRPDLPAPQMGEPGRSVSITYWSASWQATVDGRLDSITSLYPNAAIDHYPFEASSLPRDSEAQKQMAARYSPARALGNQLAGPRATPVQDLIAQGAGSLTPAPATTSTGSGHRTQNGWSVVITLHLSDPSNADFRSHVAFAVWDGAGEEVGARKMRTDWIPLIAGGNP